VKTMVSLSPLSFPQQSTVKEPAKKNMDKGVSAAYGVIVMTYWQLASDLKFSPTSCTPLLFLNGPS